VTNANKRKVFSILIGGIKGHGIGKVRGMVVRPLDFRIIDTRLAANAYGRLPKAFATDVQHVWFLCNDNLCFNIGFVMFLLFPFL
jgi:hypothetical protein